MRPAHGSTQAAVRLGFALSFVLLYFVGCSDFTKPKPEAEIPLLLGGGTGSHYRMVHVPPEQARSNRATNMASLNMDDPMINEGHQRLDATTNSLVGFPAGGTAYFRDKVVQENAILNANFDGQTWDTRIVYPDGHFDLGGVITFREHFNGEDNCFLLDAFTRLCGGDQVFLFTIINVQCAPKGTYTFVGITSGADHYSTTFNIVETVPPTSFTPELQSSYTDNYDNACKGPNGTITCTGAPGEIKKTIAQKGCALTSVAMAMNAAGVPTGVQELNTWMNDSGGYADKGNLLFDKFEAYAKSKGANLKYTKLTDTTTANLRNLICLYGPQVLEVKSKNDKPGDSTQHFVLATGIGADGKPTISDPGDGTNPSITDYASKFVSVRKIQRRTGITDTLGGGIIIHFYSPGEILLTNPAGQRVGYDPGRGTLVSEIPFGSYEQNAAYSSLVGDGSFVTDEFDPPKEIEVSDPVNGDYTVNVAGTGTGTYLLRIDGFGPGGRSSNARFADVPITPGEVHAYKFHYDASQMGQPGVGFPMSGAFNGGGQSAASDKMLTYARPGQKTTSLPAGTTSYAMLIFYNPGLTVSTFNAVLNGVDITASFHPTPGGSEAVSLPLAAGRNVLKLTAKGTTNGKSASDADQLVFKLP